MSKQIKLTDSVAAELEKRAREDNLSLAGEVAKLLTSETAITPGTTVLEHIDKRFDELLSAINNTAVDRVEQGGNGGGRRAPGGKEWVNWDQMSYIIFTHDDDDDAWYPSSQAVFQFKNGAPDELAYYVQDGTIFIDGARPEPLLKVTPDIREAIDKHFTYEEN